MINNKKYYYEIINNKKYVTYDKPFSCDDGICPYGGPRSGIMMFGDCERGYYDMICEGYKGKCIRSFVTVN